MIQPLGFQSLQFHEFGSFGQEFGYITTSNFQIRSKEGLAGPKKFQVALIFSNKIGAFLDEMGNSIKNICILLLG